MSVERVMVNGHELTAFDLPPEPSETYTVNVDGLGEIVVEKGEPPKEKDVPAMYMRKLVPELCEQNAELYRENAKLRELLRGWQVYAVDNTFGDIYKSEDVVDSNVVTFCDKHGYRLYTSMEVYGLLHDPNANERILTHDELPETIPCSEVFADIDV